MIPRRAVLAAKDEFVAVSMDPGRDLCQLGVPSVDYRRVVARGEVEAREDLSVMWPDHEQQILGHASA